MDAVDADGLDRCCAGAEAASQILARHYGLTRVSKARLDLSTKTGFDSAVSIIASRLRRAARGQEVEAVRAAARVLNVDWSATTPSERRRLVGDAMEAARRHLGLIPKRIEAVFGSTMPDVFRAGRRDARETTGSPRVRVSLTDADDQAIRSIQRSSGLFVTDAMGRRVDEASAAAREIVAEGVAEGLGRREIAANLREKATGRLATRTGFYWEVVAAAFVGRGRSWSQLLGYQDAGIRRYRIEAVLDRATTQICRFLHGKEFAVSDGLRLLERENFIAEPEQIKRANPWVRIARPPNGDPMMVAETLTGPVRVATIEQPAGGPDQIGRYTNALDERGLVGAGIGFPPYHGLCRSTTIPVL